MQDIPKTPCGGTGFLVAALRLADNEEGRINGTMLTRRLGKSRIEINALGMGCWAIGGLWTWARPGEKPYPAGSGQTDDRESIRAVHAALDAGVTLFDTAANFGAGGHSAAWGGHIGLTPPPAGAPEGNHLSWLARRPHLAPLVSACPQRRKPSLA